MILLESPRAVDIGDASLATLGQWRKRTAWWWSRAGREL